MISRKNSSDDHASMPGGYGGRRRRLVFDRWASRRDDWLDFDFNVGPQDVPTGVTARAPRAGRLPIIYRGMYA